MLVSDWNFQKTSIAFDTESAIAFLHLIFQGSTTQVLLYMVYTFQNFKNIVFPVQWNQSRQEIVMTFWNK